MRVITITRCIILWSLLSVVACSDSDSPRPNPVTQLAAVTDFEAYTWQEVPAGSRWEPRAGLQALELDGRFYLFGGRTPRPPAGPPVWQRAGPDRRPRGATGGHHPS